MKKRKAEIILEYQNYIEHSPVPPEQLFSNACVNDKTTITSWHDTWVKNLRDNHKAHGPFGKNHIGELSDKLKYKPCIVAGAGPSLKRNGELLKTRGEIGLISCLHNFH